MNLLSKDSDRIRNKELMQSLKFEVENQIQILKNENLQRLEKIGYVRPRTRLQQMYADEYMSDKQYANILGLEQVIEKNPELTDEKLEEFILKNGISLRFLNRVIKLVPDMMDIIRSDGANGVVFRYVRVLEYNRKNRRKL